MTRSSDDYFRYFPVSPDFQLWGVGVSAAGFTRIPAGAPYPPVEHPADHRLDWKRGRVLDALQIVLILAGHGWLETRATGRKRIESGMVFLLLPQTWHRYRPDPKTGWEESWLELQGPVVDGLLRAGTFPASSVLRRGAINAGLSEVIESIHRRARKENVGFDPESSAACLHVLSIFTRIGSAGTPPSVIQRAVQAAENHLADHHAESVNMEALAGQLGVAYSHFRRAFRAQTGFAPWQYVIRLRLTRARRMLASSDAKLDDIAARVGFGSGFHLSSAFKQAYGQSPAAWRKTLTAHA